MTIGRNAAAGAWCLLAVAGCGNLEAPVGTPPANEPQVTELELVHTVYFDTDQASIPASEAEALRRFARLVDQQLALEELVIGHADVRGSDAHNDPLSVRRAMSVVQLLEAEGFPPERISNYGLGRRLPVAAPDSETGWRLSRRVEVLARGVAIVEPGCPDWSQPTAMNAGNLPTSNFGCATSLNLVRMLADPRELVRGAPLGPADGTREAAAVARYRADDVKLLQVEGASQ
jgi:outer membrane protein OmpA-like peptidoglycan-associated protein